MKLLRRRSLDRGILHLTRLRYNVLFPLLLFTLLLPQIPTIAESLSHARVTREGGSRRSSRKVSFENVIQENPTPSNEETLTGGGVPVTQSPKQTVFLLFLFFLVESHANFTFSIIFSSLGGG